MQRIAGRTASSSSASSEQARNFTQIPSSPKWRIDGAHSASPHAQVWLEQQRAVQAVDCERISFEDSREWCHFGGLMQHRTGRFFSVAGIETESSFPGLTSARQAIIDQPEIGILGFLTQRRDGRQSLLVQAKLEPGNVGNVQMSPTLQATESNYCCVHGGTEPDFLQWFIQPPPQSVIVNELQSEQGTRFFRKRNRNMVVEVPAHESIEHSSSFRWVSYAEFADLLKRDNIVNTDARSVVSCLPLDWLAADEELYAARQRTAFGQQVTLSAESHDVSAISSVDSAREWCVEMKSRFHVQSQLVPLERLADWGFESDRFHQPAGGPFSFIQIRVETNSREVAAWDQPIVSSHGEGLIGFLCQRREGLLHFLVQARAEAGLHDGVELTTTVQCDPGFEVNQGMRSVTPFLEHFQPADSGAIHLDVRQSEEGGRFFRDQNRYVVLEVDEHESLRLPDNYRWMTLGQMRAMPRFSHCFTNEARSLIACLMF